MTKKNVSLFNRRMLNEDLALQFGWTRCGCGDPECGAWFPPLSKMPQLLPDFLLEMEAVVKKKKSRRGKPHSAVWILRDRKTGMVSVVNFSSREEAEKAEKDLRAAFPKYPHSDTVKFVEE